MPIVPSECLTGVTSTDSQSIGASAAAKILNTKKFLIIENSMMNNVAIVEKRCRSLKKPNCLTIYLWTAAAISGPIPSPGISVTVLRADELISLWVEEFDEKVPVVLANLATLPIIF